MRAQMWAGTHPAKCLTVHSERTPPANPRAAPPSERYPVAGYADDCLHAAPRWPSVGYPVGLGHGIHSGRINRVGQQAPVVLRRVDSWTQRSRLRSPRRPGRRGSPAAASRVEGTACAHGSLGPHLLFCAATRAGNLSNARSPKSSAFCAILACRWSSYGLSRTGCSGDAPREKEGEHEEGSRADFLDCLRFVCPPLAIWRADLFK